MIGYYFLEKKYILCYCEYVFLFIADGWRYYPSTEFSEFQSLAQGEILTIEVKNVSDFKEKIEKMYPEYNL